MKTHFEDNVNLDLALNTAYAIAIDHFIYELQSGMQQDISDFQEEKEEELTAELSDEVIENSERWGRHIAQCVIDYSETDRDGEE